VSALQQTIRVCRIVPIGFHDPSGVQFFEAGVRTCGEIIKCHPLNDHDRPARA
jgi:hypothetical protein